MEIHGVFYIINNSGSPGGGDDNNNGQSQSQPAIIHNYMALQQDQIYKYTNKVFVDKIGNFG
jgi:hypothetical protein